MRVDEINESRIKSFVKMLEDNQEVEFSYNEFYYEIFQSIESGYIINVYSSDEKDGDGYYLEVNELDGGLCTGSARDAIEFML